MVVNSIPEVKSMESVKARVKVTVRISKIGAFLPQFLNPVNNITMTTGIKNMPYVACILT